jgi:hypothetical protein
VRVSVDCTAVVFVANVRVVVLWSALVALVVLVRVFWSATVAAVVRV